MFQTKSRLSLENKLMLSATLMIFLLLTIVGSLVIMENIKEIKDNTAEKAVFIARTIAKSTSVQGAILTDNPSDVLQPFAEEVRLSTGAAFIVISDMSQTRLSHPLPDKLGTPMSDLYREPVLHGEEYIYIGKGSLAPSLRANVPIFDIAHPDRQIGFVSVGFFLDKIDEMITHNILRISAVLFLALLCSVIGGTVLSKNVKKSIFGLEPWEIAEILQQRNATFEAIREGVVSVDSDGRIRLINKEALQLLGLKQEQADALPLQDILPDFEINAVLSDGQALYDKELFVGQAVFLTNTLPIIVKGQTIGAVITFRDRTEMIRLAEELTGVNNLMDSFRAQSHEFKNKLHTISGLIQLKKYDIATDLLTKYSEVSGEIFSDLQKGIRDSLTLALLAGKASRFAELGIKFTILPNSSLTRLPGRLSSGDMVVVLGNLLENAMEAVKDEECPEIHIALKEDSHGLSIIVQNTGPWIPPELNIYQKGISTKGLHRGLGLPLVREKVFASNGSIEHTNLAGGGVEFRIFIPQTV